MILNVISNVIVIHILPIGNISQANFINQIFDLWNIKEESM